MNLRQTLGQSDNPFIEQFIHDGSEGPIQIGARN